MSNEYREESRTVIAVLPLFNPDAKFNDRLLALSRQVDGVVLVDDGSRTPFIVDSLGFDGLVLLRQENEGIASAINVGIRVALEAWPDAAFVITVDQDSTFDHAYVRAAIETYDSAVRAGVAVVAVCAERFNDWVVSADDAGFGYRSTRQVAQSGLLLPRPTINRFGFFREDLFIDCVDTEFVLRVERAGGLVLVGRGCQLLHEVGRSIPLHFFGRRVVISGRARSFSYHGAIRRYYITRNRLIVYPEYARVAPRWLVRDTVEEARTAVLSLIFGPEKKAQILAIALGIADGARKRLGRASPAVEHRLQERHVEAVPH
jgi:rhamnosyltransferase